MFCSARRVFHHVCFRDFAFSEGTTDGGVDGHGVSYEENSHRTSMLGSVSACLALKAVEQRLQASEEGGRGTLEKQGWWKETCCGNGEFGLHLDDKGRKHGNTWPKLSGMPRAVDLWKLLRSQSAASSAGSGNDDEEAYSQLELDVDTGRILEKAEKQEGGVGQQQEDERQDAEQQARRRKKSRSKRAGGVSNSRFYSELVRLADLRPFNNWGIADQTALDASLAKLVPDPFQQ